MLAKKANKVYQISEEQKEGYLKDGYDICDEKGNVVLRSPLSTVKYADYEELLKENASLKKENEQLAAELKTAKKKLTETAAKEKKSASEKEPEENGEKKAGEKDGSV